MTPEQIEQLIEQMRREFAVAVAELRHVLESEILQLRGELAQARHALAYWRLVDRAARERQQQSPELRLH
jgi:hypothetical protein